MEEGSNVDQYPEASISREERVRAIEEITGYEFNDPILLEHAFTHSSFHEKGTKERYYHNRLEFLGDSLLGFMVSENHYDTYPDLKSGTLTRLRTVHVDNEKLARVGLKHNLYKFLRNKIQHYAKQINDFIEHVEVSPVYSYGGINFPKVVSDMVEALVGAIYLDSSRSVETTWMIVSKLLVPTIHPDDLLLNPVTMIHEFCQKHRFNLRAVDSWAETGEMSYVMDDKTIEIAKFPKNKKTAQHLAAQNACYVVKDLSKQIKDTHV